MKRKQVANLAIFLVAAILLILITAYIIRELRPEVFIFEGVSGPLEESVVPPPDPDPLGAYARGTTSRLAILLTDRESSWLGLAHGLRSLGVPFLVTTDPDLDFENYR